MMGDYWVLKSEIEKVGSNPKTAGKKIGFDLVEPYDLVSKHGALEGMETKSPRMDQGLNGEINESYLYWCGRRDSNPHAVKR